MSFSKAEREIFVRALSRMENLIKVSGLGLSHVVIVHVLQENEPLSNGQIAALSGFSLPTVSRCMAKLVALNMVRATLDETDLRKNTVRLESRARSVLFEIKRNASCDFDAVLYAYRSLVQASRSLPAGFRSASSTHGLSSYACRVLLCFDESLSISVGELSARSALGQSSVSMVLKTLQSNGLAMRVDRAHPDDARKHYYALTDRGILSFRTLCEAIEDKSE